jgi:OmpA family
MGNNQQGTIHSASDGGTAGTVAPVEPFKLLIGSATSNEFNTVRLRLIPIACWKVDEVRFAFDSSFVTPEIKTELQMLSDLRSHHAAKVPATGHDLLPPLSIFGHADPIGHDDYNKALSGRRAKAIYALLIFNSAPGKAVGLWHEIAATENWGADHRKAMKANVPPGTSDSDLFRAYMASLSGPDFKLTSKDFLGQGADSGGKGDFQGCSSFNPLLIFSQQRQKDFEKAEQDQDKAALADRNAANAPNRRVLLLLFMPGSRVIPGKWPCPRASEGIAGCVRRFWSDGQKRRSTRLPADDRTFDATADTFACRFYQRLSESSPCERTLKSVTVRLYDAFGQSIPFAPFSVSVSGGALSRVDRADAQGFITIRDVETPASCDVHWGLPPKEGNPTDLLFVRTIFVIADNDHSPGVAEKKLSNLGYKDSSSTDNIIGFQLDFGHLADPPLAPTGDLDAQTVALLDTLHRQCADRLRDTQVEKGA